MDPWSASDWNTGAEQDWVYGDYGDYANYKDLVKYYWIVFNKLTENGFQNDIQILQPDF